MIKYKKDVQDIIEERKRLKEIEKENENTMNIQNEQFNKLREEIIRKERLRLIAEHAPKLKQFLSSRIANNEDELEIIKQYIK